MAGLTIRCLTNLATPQKNWLRRRESNSYQLVYKTSALIPIELRRKILVDREGLKPSQEVCRTSMLSLHHQPQNFWWLRVESNHQPGAYETPALPVELHSRNFWKPAEELNLVPFRPALRRFGLEDRCRERGPRVWTGREADAPLRTPRSLTVTVLSR